MRVKKMVALFVAAGFAVAAGAEEKQSVSGQGEVILDTGSYFRCFTMFRDPVFGTGQAAVPAGRKKDQMMWNSGKPPAEWRSVDFDDGSWWRAPGPFYDGYGFESSNPPVHTPDTAALLALRGRFTVEDPARVKTLSLSLVYRGGVVIYVNGKELKRSHMPEGPVTDETLADNYPVEAYVMPPRTEAPSPGGAQTTGTQAADAAGKTDQFRAAAGQKAIRWLDRITGPVKDRCEMRLRRLDQVAIPADMLRKGVNVLAIEIHRAPFPADYQKVSDWWDGFKGHAGLLSLQLKSDVPGAVVPNRARPSGFQVWNASPMMPVFDMDYGEPAMPLKPVKIHACRNSRFSGQFVVSSDREINGLKVITGVLAQRGGSGIIAQTNVTVRYAAPGGPETGAASRYGTGEASRFDTLLEEAPATVAVYAKKGGRPPYGAVQPVWITVSVPSSAPGGEYEGRISVSAEGQNAIEVPVTVSVADWVMPGSTTFSTFVDMVQSPESLALYYDVPLWSGKHWALMEKTFKQLGKIGNKTVYIPLICKTHFGNSESMVRFVKQGAEGESYKGDFTVMERYLDLVEKYQGKPLVVVFYVWENWAGGEYFGKGANPYNQVPIPVSRLSGDGKVELLDLPRYEKPEAVAVWKPVADELTERMKKRGLEKAMMIGICSDIRASKEVVEFWKKVLPEAKWVIHSHGLETNIHGVPVGYSATVWKTMFAGEPEVSRSYGWSRENSIRKGFGYVTQFNRDLVFSWELTQNRLMPEHNIGGGQCGFGRNGADFFPVFKNERGQRIGMITSRYPQSNWNQLSIKTCFLAPGRDGALGTVRFENMLENVQECEARIFIEKALLDAGRRAKLGDGRVKRIQALLDDRIRTAFWGRENCGWFISSGWQEKTAALFAAAAEVAGVAGVE